MRGQSARAVARAKFSDDERAVGGDERLDRGAEPQQDHWRHADFLGREYILGHNEHQRRHIAGEQHAHWRRKLFDHFHRRAWRQWNDHACEQRRRELERHVAEARERFDRSDLSRALEAAEAALIIDPQNTVALKIRQDIDEETQRRVAETTRLEEVRQGKRTLFLSMPPTSSTVPS